MFIYQNVTQHCLAFLEIPKKMFIWTGLIHMNLFQLIDFVFVYFYTIENRYVTKWQSVELDDLGILWQRGRRHADTAEYPKIANPENKVPASVGKPHYANIAVFWTLFMKAIDHDLENMYRIFPKFGKYISFSPPKFGKIRDVLSQGGGKIWCWEEYIA